MADQLILAAVIISLAAVGVSLVRFVAGPTILNRLVAFDAVGIIAVSLIVVLAMLLKRYIYVDVGLVYGLLSFLGVLVVARTVERGL